MTATDDGYKRMEHYSRRGPICRTVYVEGSGYFWNHVCGAKQFGPFPTRDAALKDEARLDRRRNRR